MAKSQGMQFSRCADSGLLIEVEDLDGVIALYDALTVDPPDGVIDLVPAARTLLLKLDAKNASPDEIELAVRSISPSRRVRDDGVLIHVPVTYDGADLDAVASMTQMSKTAVIEAHTSSDWSVAFCGFAPGFAYLVGGDQRLVVPRNGESRTRVPAGSVGLAGSFSGIYPRESPGGWQLIGRTQLDVWQVDQNPPALLSPGVRVKFEAA